MKKIAFLPEYRKEEFKSHVSTLIKDSDLDLLIYSFGTVYSDGFVTFNERKFMTMDLKKFIDANNINIGISIGGATPFSYFPLVLSETARQDELIRYLLIYKDEMGLTHVNFDYEFPTDDELNAYFNLIERVKNEVSVEVSVCATPDCDWDDVYLNKADYVFVMGYDFYGVPSHENHHSPVEIVNYIDNNFTIDNSKIICGSPLYARQKNVDAPLLWYNMVAEDSDKYLNNDSDEYYSWSNIDMTQQKSTQMQSLGFGGIFFWEAGQDSSEHSMLLGVSSTSGLA
jgi:GH18 family chitinase